MTSVISTYIPSARTPSNVPDIYVGELETRVFLCAKEKERVTGEPVFPLLRYVNASALRLYAREFITGKVP